MEKQHKENLTKFANYIIDLEPKVFVMSFSEASSSTDDGVVCSILDWAIQVKGLEPNPFHYNQLSVDGMRILDYGVYTKKVFGLSPHSREWMWCFADAWSQIDNTPVGAFQRIMWLVNKGLPDNWKEQMDGDEPYMFDGVKDE